MKRKREIANDENAEPLTEDGTSAWETLLGKAAGDEQLFPKKRRAAQTTAKLDALKDERRLAKLPKRPVYAEPGSVSLPRFAVHSWLVGAEAREGAWTLMDLGLLVGLLGAFENRDSSLLVGARFDDQDGELTLIVPAGTGSGMRFHGMIAGSPLEGGSGFVRGHQALAVLVRNGWFTVEQTVGDLRIRLGEPARKLREGTP